jgi:hypothetical protein
VSSLLGAINFISTALNMRTDGMLLHKMPLKIKNKLNFNNFLYKRINRNYSNNNNITQQKMSKDEFNQWFVVLVEVSLIFQ